MLTRPSKRADRNTERTNKDQMSPRQMSSLGQFDLWGLQDHNMSAVIKVKVYRHERRMLNNLFARNKVTRKGHNDGLLWCPSEILLSASETTILYWHDSCRSHELHKLIQPALANKTIRKLVVIRPRPWDLKKVCSADFVIYILPDQL